MAGQMTEDEKSALRTSERPLPANVEEFIKQQVADDNERRQTLAEFRRKTGPAKKKMVQELANDAKELMRDQLNTEMQKLQHGSGFNDLQNLSKQLRNSEQFQKLTADAGQLTKALQTEYNRRKQFAAAVKTVRENETGMQGFNWDNIFKDMTICAYDAILVTAGVDTFRHNQVVTASMRAAQNRFFSGREVCDYMDTGLLMVTHVEMTANDGVGYKVTDTYDGFDYLNSPYIGSRIGERNTFVYNKITRNSLIGKREFPRPSITELQNLAKTGDYEELGRKRKEFMSKSSFLPLGRDGDVTGRVVRAHHFAILEEILLKTPGINWQIVKDAYMRAGVTSEKPLSERTRPGERYDTPSLLEDFEGRIATEYTVLIHRLVHETEKLYKANTQELAQEALPPIPTNADATDRETYATLDTQKSFIEVPLRRGAAPVVQKQYDVNGTARSREQAARDYVRRVVYTAAMHSWFPHSVAFVHLLVTLEHAAFHANDDWARNRSFFSSEKTGRSLLAEADDAIAMSIRRLRELQWKLSSGSIEQGSDRLHTEAISYIGQWLQDVAANPVANPQITIGGSSNNTRAKRAKRRDGSNNNDDDDDDDDNQAAAQNVIDNPNPFNAAVNNQADGQSFKRRIYEAFAYFNIFKAFATYPYWFTGGCTIIVVGGGLYTGRMLINFWAENRSLTWPEFIGKMLGRGLIKVKEKFTWQSVKDSNEKGQKARAFLWNVLLGTVEELNPSEANADPVTSVASKMGPEVLQAFSASVPDQPIAMTSLKDSAMSGFEKLPSVDTTVAKAPQVAAAATVGDAIADEALSRLDNVPLHAESPLLETVKQVSPVMDAISTDTVLGMGFYASVGGLGAVGLLAAAAVVCQNERPDPRVNPRVKRSIEDMSRLDISASEDNEAVIWMPGALASTSKHSSGFWDQGFALGQNLASR